MCRFGKDSNRSLGDIQIISALQAEAGFFSDDYNRLLQSLLDHRENNLLALKVFGFSLQWRDLKSIVNYYCIFKAIKKKLIFSLLAKYIV